MWCVSNSLLQSAQTEMAVASWWSLLLIDMHSGLFGAQMVLCTLANWVPSDMRILSLVWFCMLACADIPD